MSDSFTADVTESADAPPAVDADEPRRQASSIEMQGLHKRFGADTVALDGVDLTIEAGEFFTLLGPSGCGKTILLRILAGLEDADDGELSIGGRTITEVPPHQRIVNTVFQSYALFPHLSVRDNLAFGLKMRGLPAAERNARAAKIAEFIKLGDPTGQAAAGGLRTPDRCLRRPLHGPRQYLPDHRSAGRSLDHDPR